MQQNNIEHKPAKTLVFLAIAMAGLIFILSFTILLRHNLRSVSKFTQSGYSQNVPNEFTYKLEVLDAEEVYTINGYAYISGSRFVKVNTKIVLKPVSKSGDYIKIPTSMILNEEATANASDGINYSFGGITAFVIKEQLKLTETDYEIYIAYANDTERYLVNTGIRLLEAGK